MGFDPVTRQRIDQGIASALIAALPPSAVVARLTIECGPGQRSGSIVAEARIDVPGRESVVVTSELLAGVDQLVAHVSGSGRLFRVAEYSVDKGPTGWTLHSRFEY